MNTILTMLPGGGRTVCAIAYAKAIAEYKQRTGRTSLSHLERQLIASIEAVKTKKQQNQRNTIAQTTER